MLGQPVAGVAKAIGMEGVDVGYFYRSALDKARLLKEPEAYGREIKAQLPLPISNLYHLFGGSLAERNLASPDHRAENLADFRQVLKFCRAAGSPTVFILPGVINGAQTRKQALNETNGDMEAAIDWLRKKGLSKAAKKAGRVAAEGLIAAITEGTKGVVVEVNSETDFVARNDQSGSGLGVAGPAYRDIMQLALPRYGVRPSNDKMLTELPLER